MEPSSPTGSRKRPPSDLDIQCNKRSRRDTSTDEEIISSTALQAFSQSSEEDASMGNTFSGFGSGSDSDFEKDCFIERLIKPRNVDPLARGTKTRRHFSKEPTEQLGAQAGSKDPQAPISKRQLAQKQTPERRAQHTRKTLSKKFDAIKEAVEERGYWDVSDLFQGEGISKDLLCCKSKPDLERIEKAKIFFKRVPRILEHFCYLKIQEISFYIAREGKVSPPQSRVEFSILRQTQEGVIVSEASIEFCDEELAVFPCPLTNREEVRYPSALKALTGSSWLLNESDKTIIRFSDHLLEDDIVIKKCFGKIKYALLSSKVDGKKESQRNFWEDLAIKKQQEVEDDFERAELVKERFNGAKTGEKIDLAEPIRRLASFTEEIEQEEYVRFVLDNSRSGKGTLLNLPTGFGKTFIMFMVAAQHLRDVQEQKPYLVITPANNVSESWRENYALLEDMEKEGTPIFPDRKELFCVQKTREFNERILDMDGMHFVVMTVDLLRNLVTEKLLVKKRVEKEIRDPRQRYFLEFAGILSVEGFIIGSRSHWERLIDNVFQTLDFGVKALTAVNSLREKAKIAIRVDCPEFFNPSRRKSYFLNEIGENRVDFICRLKEKPELLEELFEKTEPIPFFRKLLRNQPSVEEALKKVFDYCWFWQWFTQGKKRKEAAAPSLDNLERLATSQDEKIAEYEEFKMSFGGIILDESDQIFSLTSTGPSEVTEILLDISKTFQNVSEIGKSSNPLIVASSATPWPNMMKEFKLHIQFLLPKAIGEFASLNNHMFSLWDRFETGLDASKINSEEIAKNLSVVQRHFYPWVQLLFNETTSYEAPDKSKKTNWISERLLSVECKSSCRVNVGKEILSAIRNFYSNVLNPKKSNIQEDIFESIDNEPNGKFAFYVELTKDASKLAMALSDHFLEKQYERYSGSRVQIGFFYNEEFVKKQGGGGKSGVSSEYTNITYNMDRMLNIHAFNNIFAFNDFYKYLNQHFGTLSINTSKEIIRRIVSRLRGQETEQLKKAKGLKGALFDLGKKLDGGLALSEREERLKTSLEGLIRLEEHSRSEVIQDFKETAMKMLNVDDGVFSEKVLKAHEGLRRVKKSKGNPKIIFEDELEDLEAALYHYLHKISVSNVLIFGNAGTSGMRIDADHLYILSGAWTEGKLNQIKGRVGRPKSNDNQRKCAVHSPVTNTNFEYLILKYYIKKSLYNSFISRGDPFSSRELCSRLYLAGLLYKYYNDLSDGFICETLHERVKKEMDKGNYLDLPPYEKALAITPENLREVCELFTEGVLKYVNQDFPAGLPEVRNPSGREGSQIGDAPPEILPVSQIDWSPDEITSLKDRGVYQQTLLFIVPTRGDHPDLSIEKFSEYVEKSLGDGCRAIIMFGVNQVCNAGNQEEKKTGLLKKTEELRQELKERVSGKVFVKISSFLWFEKDRKGKVEKSSDSIQRAYGLLTENFEKKQVQLQELLFFQDQFIRAIFSLHLDQETVLEMQDELERMTAELITPKKGSKPSGRTPSYVYGENYYEMRNTSGQNNACAIHAILGEENESGLFRYDDAKKRYTDELWRAIRTLPERRSSSEERACEAYFESIKDYLAASDPDAAALFQSGIGLELKEKWTEIEATFKALKRENHLEEGKGWLFLGKEDNSPFLRLIMDDVQESGLSSRWYGKSEQEVLAMVEENPSLIVDFVNAQKDPNPFLKLLESFHNAHKEKILEIRKLYQRIQQDWDGKQKELVFSQEMVKNYLDTVNTDAFYLDSNDIKVIANLFDKTVVLFGVGGGDGEVINGDHGKGEPVVVQHYGAHFSRCVRVDGKNIDKDFKFKPKRASGVSRPPPIGAMRNHCLLEAQNIWRKLKSEETFFFSMDGDTELTKESLDRIIKRVSHKTHPLAVATGGYSFALPASDNTLEDLKWSQKSNDISMRINHRLFDKERGFHSYYGYPSEPLIGLSPLLTKNLFESDLKRDCSRGDLHAPFGYHDNEGRRFYRYLRNLRSGDVVSHGPSLRQYKRPKLHYYERFITHPPSHQAIGLNKKELSQVIERLHGQSQHSIRPWFMGSNIASALKTERGPIRKYCGHFYAKAFLNLLGLGPERGRALSEKILTMHKSGDKEPSYQAPEDQKMFGVQEEEWKSFVANHFNTSHLHGLPEEKINRVGKAVANWALSVFLELEYQFGRTYEEEKVGEGYSPMEMPQDYPKKATDLSEKDHEEAKEALAAPTLTEPSSPSAEYHSEEEPIEILHAREIEEEEEDDDDKSIDLQPYLDATKQKSCSTLEKVLEAFKDYDSLKKKGYFEKEKFPEVQGIYLKGGSPSVLCIIARIQGEKNEKKRTKKILNKVVNNRKSKNQKGRDYLVISILDNQEMMYGYSNDMGDFKYTREAPQFFDLNLTS